MATASILDVTPENIHELGVLCGAEDAKYRRGCANKMEWYAKHYSSGLRIKLSVDESGQKTGMVEYAPGEHAWRGVDAPGYTVIHCLHVLRRHTRRGYGSLLLDACARDSAQTNGLVLVSSSKPWVNGKRFFLRHGFRQIERVSPYFELLARPFRPAPPPRFIPNAGCEADDPRGIAVYYTDQCPIVEYAVGNIIRAAAECDRDATAEKLETSAAARRAPSPYATLCLLVDGRFVTHRVQDVRGYRALLEKDSPPSVL